MIFNNQNCEKLRMEEHAFDPVRAVASLSPSSLLCPTGALRVLGSGFIGIVFLEEDEGFDAGGWVVVFGSLFTLFLGLEDTGWRLSNLGLLWFNKWITYWIIWIHLSDIGRLYMNVDRTSCHIEVSALRVSGQCTCVRYNDVTRNSPNSQWRFGPMKIP